MKKAIRVDPGVIIEQGWNRWPDMHPEDFCHRCGVRNIVWSVESRWWNLAVEQLGLARGAILCPACFLEGFELVKGETSWTLVPRFVPDDADSTDVES